MSLPTPELPAVTCVITAYNQERFVIDAVRSALEQDYPADLLDVVVVNDGSTDRTGRLLDETFGGDPRVRTIHQDNEGFIAAMNRALEAAGGELIGILDGDDMWPRDRLRNQVPLLLRRPEVGLVHGDMKIVDTAGRTLNPSFFRYSGFEVSRGRVLAKLIRQNFVSGGATLVRTALRDFFHPIPADLVYPDWYIATRVAERAEIDHVDVTVNLYRMHGANMGLGGIGRKFFSDLRNNVRIQRWMLQHYEAGAEPLRELALAAETMIVNATRAALELGSSPAQILPVSAGDRTASGEAKDRAMEMLDAGLLEGAGRTCIGALALDPWNGQARAGLAIAVARLDRPPTDTAPSNGLADTRKAAVIAFGRELLDTPELLSVYTEVVDGSHDATLLIQCPVADATAIAEALGERLHAAGLDSAGAADLLLHPCDDAAELLVAPVVAVYTRRAKPAALATLPRVDDRSADRLLHLINR